MFSDIRLSPRRPYAIIALSRRSGIMTDFCRAGAIYITKRSMQMIKKFFEEFKKFISKGNVMDMAVGIIIGGAFTSIVSSLVNDIINPVLGLFGGMNFDQLAWNITGDVTLYYGKFITAVVNFLIMALIVFLLVKVMNTAMSRIHKEEPPKTPTTKTCPFCKSEIAIAATRCPHCTSQLEDSAAKE